MNNDENWNGEQRRQKDHKAGPLGILQYNDNVRHCMQYKMGDTKQCMKKFTIGPFRLSDNVKTKMISLYLKQFRPFLL